MTPTSCQVGVGQEAVQGRDLVLVQGVVPPGPAGAGVAPLGHISHRGGRLLQVGPRLQRHLFAAQPASAWLRCRLCVAACAVWGLRFRRQQSRGYQGGRAVYCLLLLLPVL